MRVASGWYAPGGDRDVNILVLAQYPQGTVPSQRFRFEQYVERLREDGIRLDVSSFLTEGAIRALYTPGGYATKVGAVLRGMCTRLGDVIRARRYDAVLVTREATPLGYPWVERLLGSLGVPYVFDFDDAIYLSNASEANRVVARLKFAAKTAMIVRHADLVVAGNDYLAAWAARHAARVVVIPTTVDTAAYSPARASHDTSRSVCIGWTGSLTTVRYLDPIATVLRDLQRDYDVRIRVVGDEHFRIPGATVDAIRWQADTEVTDLQEIDIGVMPLPDNEWACGKCGLKALQYMALGIPTVMSPVGVNRQIAAGGAARLAESSEDWTRVLTELVLDKSLREVLGKKGREQVEREYSVDVVAPRWAEALRSVASSQGAMRA